MVAVYKKEATLRLLRCNKDGMGLCEYVVSEQCVVATPWLYKTQGVSRVSSLHCEFRSRRGSIVVLWALVSHIGSTESTAIDALGPAVTRTRECFTKSRQHRFSDH
jgi:hypothetical protein